MTDPVAPADHVLVFHGRELAPFFVQPRDIPQTPRGRANRLARAAAEAFSVAIAARGQALGQLDDGADVIMLVCAVDCPLGRQLVERRGGALLTAAACGVFAFAVSPAELASTFGAQGAAVGAELALLEAGPGHVKWAFAVNGMTLDLRVSRIEATLAEGDQSAPCAAAETAAP